MTPIDENTFYRELGNVPRHPDTLFETIERKTRRPRYAKWAALAASVIILLGIATLMPRHDRTVYHSGIDPEVLSELDFAYDYLNGNDIEEQLSAVSFAFEDQFFPGKEQ
ncbi:hypothetical protein QA601_03200 [Chitinispirillales bacterium ANBcel5]|uniref:hypothetical protein n=1 Tax=Cellulosispirillum alkaliphilum TaxID=3039283 RepID=UPI002A56FE1A|nr:hypothetical protein [Chitinispirillales bacterium ANBcel5]